MQILINKNQLQGNNVPCALFWGLITSLLHSSSVLLNLGKSKYFLSCKSVIRDFDAIILVCVFW